MPDFIGAVFQQNSIGASTGLGRTTYNFYTSLNTINAEKVLHLSIYWLVIEQYENNFYILSYHLS